MLYQDSLTAQTNLSDPGALPAPRHMAAQATDQTLSNAKTATTANHRDEAGIVATWNGEKIYVTAFYSNLKTVIATRPDMWSFQLHGHFQTSTAKTVCCTTAQAHALADGMHPVGTWDNPVNIQTVWMPLVPTPSAPRTRAQASAAPDEDPASTAPARVPSHIVASPAAFATMNHQLFAFITDRITDRALVEQLQDDFQFQGRELLAHLAEQCAHDLTPAEKATLNSEFDRFRAQAPRVSTRAAFSNFKRQYTLLVAGLPAELRPNDATITSHWRHAITKGDITRARSLDAHIKLAYVTDVSLPSDTLRSMTNVLNSYLVNEESLALESAACKTDSRPTLDKEEVTQLIARALYQGGYEKKKTYDPNKHPSKTKTWVNKKKEKTTRKKPDTTKPWKAGDPPCNHCGGGHWNKDCTHENAGTFEFAKSERAKRQHNKGKANAKTSTGLDDLFENLAGDIFNADIPPLLDEPMAASKMLIAIDPPSSDDEAVKPDDRHADAIIRVDSPVADKSGALRSPHHFLPIRPDDPSPPPADSHGTNAQSLDLGANDDRAVFSSSDDCNGALRRISNGDANSRATLLETVRPTPPADPAVAEPECHPAFNTFDITDAVIQAPIQIDDVLASAHLDAKVERPPADEREPPAGGSDALAPWRAQMDFNRVNYCLEHAEASYQEILPADAPDFTEHTTVSERDDALRTRYGCALLDLLDGRPHDNGVMRTSVKAQLKRAIAVLGRRVKIPSPLDQTVARLILDFLEHFLKLATWPFRDPPCNDKALGLAERTCAHLLSTAALRQLAHTIDGATLYDINVIGAQTKYSVSQRGALLGLLGNDKYYEKFTTAPPCENNCPSDEWPYDDERDHMLLNDVQLQAAAFVEQKLIAADNTKALLEVRCAPERVLPLYVVDNGATFHHIHPFCAQADSQPSPDATDERVECASIAPETTVHISTPVWQNNNVRAMERLAYHTAPLVNVEQDAPGAEIISSGASDTQPETTSPRPVVYTACDGKRVAATIVDSPSSCTDSHVSHNVADEPTDEADQALADALDKGYDKLWEDSASETIHNMEYVDAAACYLAHLISPRAYSVASCARSLFSHKTQLLDQAPTPAQATAEATCAINSFVSALTMIESPHSRWSAAEASPRPDQSVTFDPALALIAEKPIIPTPPQIENILVDLAHWIARGAPIEAARSSAIWEAMAFTYAAHILQRVDFDSPLARLYWLRTLRYFMDSQNYNAQCNECGCDHALGSIRCPPPPSSRSASPTPSVASHDSWGSEHMLYGGRPIENSSPLCTVEIRETLDSVTFDITGLTGSLLAAFDYMRLTIVHLLEPFGRHFIHVSELDEFLRVAVTACPHLLQGPLPRADRLTCNSLLVSRELAAALDALLAGYIEHETERTGTLDSWHAALNTWLPAPFDPATDNLYTSLSRVRGLVVAALELQATRIQALPGANAIAIDATTRQVVIQQPWGPNGLGEHTAPQRRPATNEDAVCNMQRAMASGGWSAAATAAFTTATSSTQAPVPVNIGGHVHTVMVTTQLQPGDALPHAARSASVSEAPTADAAAAELEALRERQLELENELAAMRARKASSEWAPPPRSVSNADAEHAPRLTSQITRRPPPYDPSSYWDRKTYYSGQRMEMRRRMEEDEAYEASATLTDFAHDQPPGTTEVVSTIFAQPTAAQRKSDTAAAVLADVCSRGIDLVAAPQTSSYDHNAESVSPDFKAVTAELGQVTDPRINAAFAAHAAHAQTRQSGIDVALDAHKRRRIDALDDLRIDRAICADPDALRPLPADAAHSTHDVYSLVSKPARVRHDPLARANHVTSAPHSLMGRPVDACLDSGATYHTTSQLSDLCNVSPHRQGFIGASGTTEYSVAIGDLACFVRTVDNKVMLVNFHAVRYVPNHNTTLLSAHMITEDGNDIHFGSSSSLTLKGAGHPHARTVALDWRDNMYILRIVPINRVQLNNSALRTLRLGASAMPHAMSLSNAAPSPHRPHNDSDTGIPPAWRTRSTRSHLHLLAPDHAAAAIARRLHAGLPRIKLLAAPNAAVGVPPQVAKAQKVPLKAMNIANAMHLPHSGTFVFEARRPGEIVYSDVAGPFKPALGGHRYFIVFIDGYTRFGIVYPMHTRDEVPHWTRRFIAEFTTVANRGRSMTDSLVRVEAIRSDNAGEMASHSYYAMLDEGAISHEYSPAHTHQNNGVAERFIGTILRTARAMYETMGADLVFRRRHLMYVAVAACDAHNATPADPSNKKVHRPEHAPVTRLNGTPPDIVAIFPFGCAVIVSKQQPEISKSTLDARGWAGINLGRSPDTPSAYNVLLNDGRIVVTSDVRFNETSFPLLEHSSVGRALKPPPTVLVLFSGPYSQDGNLAAALGERGAIAVQVDNDPTTGGGWSHDIRNDSFFEGLLSNARKGAYAAVHAAPPCSTFSVARFKPPTGDDPSTAGAPPVRARSSPDGLPTDQIEPDHVAELARANEIVRRMCILLKAAFDAGSTLTVENPADRGDPTSTLFMHPEHSPLWRTTVVRELITHAGLELVTFSMGMLGSEYQKYSTLAFTPRAAPALRPLAQLQCNRPPGTYKRAAGRDADGIWATRHAASYPPALNFILADALVGYDDSPDPPTPAVPAPSPPPGHSSSRQRPTTAPDKPTPAPPVDHFHLLGTTVEVYWSNYAVDDNHWFRALVDDIRLTTSSATRSANLEYHFHYVDTDGSWSDQDLKRWHKVAGPGSVEWRRVPTPASSSPPDTPPPAATPTFASDARRRSARLAGNAPVPTVPSPTSPQLDNVLAASARLFQAVALSDSLPCLALKARTVGNDGITPRSHKQAMLLDSVNWSAAEGRELHAHRTENSMRLIKISQVPKGRKILRFVWAYKKKRNGKHKARLCVDGSGQIAGVDFDQSFAAALRSSSLRLLMAYAARRRLRACRWDVTSAYLQGDLLPNERVYVFEPPGYETHGSARVNVYEVTKPIYGMVQAGRRFQRKLFPWIVEQGFTQSTADPCVFTKRRLAADGTIADELIVGVYVDDLCVLYPRDDNDSLYAQFRRVFFSTWKAEDEGELDDLLNVHIRRLGNGDVVMHQAPYIATMVQRFLPDGVPSNVQRNNTPCTSELAQDVADALVAEPTTDKALVTEYQQLIGSLIYAMVQTRPDIAYAVNMLSRAMSRPTPALLVHARRVLCYLARHADVGLTFSAESSSNIEGWSDASWEKDKSTTGIAVKWQEAVISWKAQKQKCVATSSFHAELIAASEAAKDLIHCDAVASDLTGEPSHEPVSMYVDNKALVDVAYNPEHHDKTRHIANREFFVREAVENMQIVVRYVNTTDNLADFFTKYLPPKQFFPLRDKLMNNKHLPPQRSHEQVAEDDRRRGTSATHETAQSYDPDHCRPCDIQDVD